MEIKMQPCDRPVAEMSLGEAVDCTWEKGSKALSVIVHNPGVGEHYRLGCWLSRCAYSPEFFVVASWVADTSGEYLRRRRA